MESGYGPVQVKLKRLGDEILGATPEYEDCQRLADVHGVPVRLVYEAAQAQAHVQWVQDDHGQIG